MAVTAACKPPQLCPHGPAFAKDNRSVSLAGSYETLAAKALSGAGRAHGGTAPVLLGAGAAGPWGEPGPRRSLPAPSALPARRTRVKGLCVTIPVVFYCCCHGRRRNRTLVIGMFGINIFSFKELHKSSEVIAWYMYDWDCVYQYLKSM